MTLCPNLKFLAIYLPLILCGEAVLQDVWAEDYYFRPTNIAMIDSWTSELSFTVSNPSKMPIVLKLTTRRVGVQKAQFHQLPDALRLSAATLVVKAGQRQEINLDYRPQGYNQQASSYVVVVEQLPILYVPPGSKGKPSTMVVTRYTADIEIRENGATQRQFAINNFGRKSEIKTRLVANYQANQ